MTLQYKEIQRNTKEILKKYKENKDQTKPNQSKVKQSNISCYILSMISIHNYNAQNIKETHKQNFSNTI